MTSSPHNQSKSTFVQLRDDLPCPPQELLFQHYAPYFELSDASVFTLTTHMFPSLAVDSRTLGDATSADNLGETLQKMKVLSLPSIPTENIREDILRDLQKRAVSTTPTSLFPFLPRYVETQITCACLGETQRRSPTSSNGARCTVSGNAKVVTGLSTGVILVWELDAYEAQVHQLREAARAAAATHASCTGETAAYVCTDSRAGRSLTGVTMLGCHSLGSVTCAAACDDGNILISGAADGSLYMWDLSGAYVPGRLVTIAASLASTADTALDSFATSLRSRHLLARHDKVHVGPITALGALSQTFISGGADHVVRVWQLRRSQSHAAEPRGTTYPGCVATQTFQMSGWVRSVEPFHMQAILDDEFIITDDAGWVLRLQSTRPAAASAGKNGHDTIAGTASNGGRRVAEAPSDVYAGVFREKWRRRAQSEETRRLGLGVASHSNQDSTDTIARTLTIGADRLIVAVGFSPVVHVMDTHSLQRVLRITHPSLTAEGSTLNGPTAARGGPTAAVSSRSCGGPSTLASASQHRVSPLRFIDILYVSECDGLLLLDNRNSVFLYDRATGRFVAFAHIPYETAEKDVRDARKLLIAPSGFATAACTHGEGVCIAFLVVCDSSICTCSITFADTALINRTAHTDAVIGVHYFSATDRHAAGPSAQPMESLTGERIAFVSASRDGTVCCLDKHLRSVRLYTGASWDAACVSGGCVRIAELGDVTAFHYSSTLGYVVTGHDSGAMCVWRCEDELPDVVACPSVHGNTVSGITEVLLEARHKRVEDIRFITVGFDGFVASWKYVEKRRPVVAKRHRLSWNELASVVAVPGTSGDALAVADQGGAIFVLDAKELNPILVCASCELTVVPSSRWCCDTTQWPRRLRVDYGHTAGVTALCVMSNMVVSGDERGTCLIWRTDSPLQAPMRVEWPDEVTQGEIECACALDADHFVLAVRGGILVLFLVNTGAAAAVFGGFHDCKQDITALSSICDGSDTHSLVVGLANGELAILSRHILLESD